MKKIKKLCDLKKEPFDLIKNDILKIVSKPSFICKKCLRVAVDKKYLCKGEALKNKD